MREKEKSLKREEKKQAIGRSLFYLLLLMSVFPTSGQAQNKEKKISLEFKNEQLASALKKIEKSCDYMITFNHEDVSLYRVSCTLKQATINEAMNQVLENKP